MVGDQLPAPVAVHEGAGGVGAADGVDVLTPDEVAVVVRRNGTGEDGGERMALGAVGDRLLGGFHEGWVDVGQLDQSVADEALLEVPGPGNGERDADGAFVETAAFKDQAVIAEHLAVIAHEDDDRVLALASLVEVVEDAAELLVDELDHGVVGGGGFGEPPVFRVAGLKLEVDAGSGDLVLVSDVFGPVGGGGHVQGVVAAVELQRGVEAFVGVEGVDAHQPGLAFGFGVFEELEGHLGAPGCLV